MSLILNPGFGRNCVSTSAYLNWSNKLNHYRPLHLFQSIQTVSVWDKHLFWWLNKPIWGRTTRPQLVHLSDLMIGTVMLACYLALLWCFLLSCKHFLHSDLSVVNSSQPRVFILKWWHVLMQSLKSSEGGLWPFLHTFKKKVKINDFFVGLSR